MTKGRLKADFLLSEEVAMRVSRLAAREPVRDQKDPDIVLDPRRDFMSWHEGASIAATLE